MLYPQASEAQRTEELEQVALEKKELLEMVKTIQRDATFGCRRQLSRDKSSA